MLCLNKILAGLVIQDSIIIMSQFVFLFVENYIVPLATLLLFQIISLPELLTTKL